MRYEQICDLGEFLVKTKCPFVDNIWRVMISIERGNFREFCQNLCLFLQNLDTEKSYDWLFAEQQANDILGVLLPLLINTDQETQQKKMILYSGISDEVLKGAVAEVTQRFSNLSKQDEDRGYIVFCIVWLMLLSEEMTNMTKTVAEEDPAQLVEFLRTDLVSFFVAYQKYVTENRDNWITMWKSLPFLQVEINIDDQKVSLMQYDVNLWIQKKGNGTPAFNQLLVSF
jgi:hypothetical protein